MDENISGFTMTEANKIRKAISKKKANLIKESKELYYKKGLSLGTRKEMLEYVWEKQFSYSLGLKILAQVKICEPYYSRVCN